VVVTAGPTRERIDPVRFISNYSTGAFGYEIAREAAARGYRVTLVSGPVSLEPPGGVSVVNVESARQMKDAVEKAVKGADCLVMAAAVSDWKARRPAARKLKRGAGRAALELVENPDIVAGIGRRRGREAGGVAGKGPGGRLRIVGFALETDDLEKNALAKLRKKGLDVIVANSAGARSNPFGYNRVDIVILDRAGRRTRVRGSTKAEAAKIILDRAFGFNI
jgi:phosphopantothenoylcysteine decarboxylase/phosphopantothenate--cysteine ligase